MTREELDLRAEVAAKDARCQRCMALILEQPEQSAVLTGHFRTVSMRRSDTLQFCGPCGLAFYRFLLGAL